MIIKINLEDSACFKNVCVSLYGQRVPASLHYRATRDSDISKQALNQLPGIKCKYEFVTQKNGQRLVIVHDLLQLNQIRIVFELRHKQIKVSSTFAFIIKYPVDRRMSPPFSGKNAKTEEYIFWLRWVGRDQKLEGRDMGSCLCGCRSPPCKTDNSSLKHLLRGTKRSRVGMLEGSLWSVTNVQ